jgi:hypothetical protein
VLATTSFQPLQANGIMGIFVLNLGVVVCTNAVVLIWGQGLYMLAFMSHSSLSMSGLRQSFCLPFRYKHKSCTNIKHVNKGTHRWVRTDD